MEFKNDQELLDYAWQVRDDDNELTALEQYAKSQETLEEIQQMAAMAYVAEDCRWDY